MDLSELVLWSWSLIDRSYRSRFVILGLEGAFTEVCALSATSIPVEHAQLLDFIHLIFKVSLEFSLL